VLHSRFKFNLRFKTIGEVAARISALLIYAAGARLLGADGFGLFSLAFSYASLSSVLIDSGTLTLLTRDIARDRSTAPELIRSLTLYKFLVAPFAVLIIYGLVRLIDREGISLSIFLVMGLVAVATSFTEHLYAILSGLERMDIEAGVKVINRAGALIFAVLMFHLVRSVGGFAFGMALGLWASVAFGLWWLHRNVGKLSFKINKPVLASTLKAGIPLFSAWIFLTLYVNQDRYIMSMLHYSNTDIGIYSAAAKLVDALRPIPVLLMGAVFPILSQAAVQDKALFDRIAGTLVKYSVIGLFPFAFGVTVFSDLIVRIIFGPQFVMSADILSIAIWGYVAVFLNHLFLYLLVSSDQQKKFLQGAIVLMGVNAPLCWWFMQSVGIAGGAWALIGSELALLIFNLLVSPWARRQAGMLFVRPSILAAASLALFWVLSFWMPSQAAFFIAIALYGVLVWRSSLVDVSLLRRFIV